MPAVESGTGGWNQALHPRGPGGKFAQSGSGGQKPAGAKAQQGLSPKTRADIAAFQRKHGLPVTGVPDAATIAKAQGLANAPAAARKAKAAAKHTAVVAKQEKAKAVRVQKAAAAAIVRRDHAHAVALVSSVNSLDPQQRAHYRAAVGGGAPKGYAWGKGDRLVSVQRAKVQAEVGKLAGPAATPAQRSAAARKVATAKAKAAAPPKSKRAPTSPIPVKPKAPKQTARHGTTTSRKGGVIIIGSGTA